jgi:hypothetical protein
MAAFDDEQTVVTAGRGLVGGRQAEVLRCWRISCGTAGATHRRLHIWYMRCTMWRLQFTRLPSTHIELCFLQALSIPVIERRSRQL